MSKTPPVEFARSILLMLVTSSIFVTTPLFAIPDQCTKPPVTGRPKIGLVLGGGGARGYAHIGVLKKLEELRIPYDYIAGTSMGSIAGGFLATGMNADDIGDVIREVDWNDMLKDSPDRANRPFRRKTEDDLGLFGPKLGVGRDSNLLPKGVVSGQKIIFMFESATSQRVLTSDFDQLPIPYRAVATDIVTGDMVVIDEGELSMAMRASMAVPGVFDPVRRNGALLVDGGLVRNLPVDVARTMGADVIIAVDVGTKLAGEDEITNALAIVYQMSGLLTVGNTNIQIQSLGEDDVLITPDIGNNIASADFDKLDEAIPLGYTAAERVQDRLRDYSLSESAYRSWREQVSRCVNGPPRVDFVELENHSRFSDDVILNLITIKPGSSLDLEKLEHDLQQIYGLGFIRQARYHIIRKDGQEGLKVTVLKDERGSQFIETGLDLSISKRGADFNIRGGYLNSALDDRGSEFRALLQIGESPGIFVDYFRPLDNKLKYSFQPSVSFFNRPLFIYDDKGRAVGELELDELDGTLGFGAEFSRQARLGAGYTRYHGKLDVIIGEPGQTPYTFNGAELFVNLDIDRLDNRYLPTSGFISSLKYTRSVEQLGADISFNQLEFLLFASHTFGRHNLIWGGQYNTTLEDNLAIYSWYTGGGFMSMSGFEPNSLIAPNYGQILTGYRYRIGKNGFLPGYAGMTLEYGNATYKRSDVFSQGILNGSFYMAYDSPLGPVYLGLGWSENRSAIYFLRLGTVFGPRSLGRR